MSSRKRAHPDGGSSNSPRKRRKPNTRRKHRNGQVVLKVVSYGDGSEEQRNWFGYAWTRISLCSMIESKSDCIKFDECDDQFDAKLVFENGEAVPDDTTFETRPSGSDLKLINGECNLDVRINTLSMYHENRSFKIVFTVVSENTRHLRPCETYSFCLVKHRLEVVRQPNERFYKDEGGRSNCLTCVVHLKDGSGNIETKRNKIPLNLRLVYGDHSPAQSQRDILEVLTQNVEVRNGMCEIDFRINEVSKNHNKRAFRLAIECTTDNPLYADISPVTTQAIMVYSKRTKKSKAQNAASNEKNLKSTRVRMRKSRSESTSVSQEGGTPTHFVPPAMMSLLPQAASIKGGALPGAPQNLPFSALLKQQNDGRIPIKQEQKNGMSNAPKGIFHTMMDWCQLAEWVLKILEWVHCGYEMDPATNLIDPHRPLYRCSYCLRYRNCAGFGQHEDTCQLKLALSQYNQKVKSVHTEFTFQNNVSGGSMQQLDEPNSSPVPGRPGDSSQTNHLPQPPTFVPNVSNNSGLMRIIPASMPFPPNGHPVFKNAMDPVAATAASFGFIAQPPAMVAPQMNGKHPLNPGNGPLFWPQPQNPRMSPVKDEGSTAKVSKSKFQLPLILDKVGSVVKERSDLGWAAFDNNKNLLGYFNDNGDFREVSTDRSAQGLDLFSDDMIFRNDSSNFLDDVREMILRKS